MGRLCDVILREPHSAWVLPVARRRPFLRPKSRALKMGTGHAQKVAGRHETTGSQRLPALLPCGPRAFPESTLMWKSRWRASPLMLL